MNVWKPIAVCAVAGLVASVGVQIASANGSSISADRHPNLTKARDSLTAATGALKAAQTANEYDLGGHAAKAEVLIAQAQSEVEQARQAANH